MCRIRTEDLQLYVNGIDGAVSRSLFVLLGNGKSLMVTNKAGKKNLEC